MSQTKLPPFCKVAFKRTNEAKVNAHLILRHNKNWVKYYLVLKKRSLQFNKANLFLRKLRFPLLFQF